MKEIKLQVPGGRSMLFTDGTGGHEEKLIIIMFGAEHSGKSRFGATGPDIVGYVPTDRKTRATAEKTAKEQGRHILMPKDDFVREALKGVRAGWMTEGKESAEIDKLTEESKKQYRSLVNQVKECTWALHDHPDVQLIEIDLFGQFYEDLKYAHYGRTGHVVKRLTGNKMFKDTSQADQELIDFVNSLASKHLILTHKSTAEYAGNNPTGQNIWKGFKHLGHSANLQLEMSVNKDYDPQSDKEDHQWHWGMSVVKSLHNPDLEGAAGQLVLRDEMISWDCLVSMVLPS